MFWGINLSRFLPSAFPFSYLIKAPFWFVALRRLHRRAQNRKTARFSGLCVLNSKLTEEEKIWQKQRSLEGISLGWRRGESWRNSKQWESTRVLLCSGSLGHKEMVLWAPKGSGQRLLPSSKLPMPNVMWEHHQTLSVWVVRIQAVNTVDLKSEKPFSLQATCKLSPSPRLWCIPWERRSPMTEMECDTNWTGLGTQF